MFVTPHPRTPAWQHAIMIMAGVVIAAIVVGALYWLRQVFVPLALAIFLTFLLTPLVRALQRLGLNRILSVLLVVTLTSVVLGGVGWLVTVQVKALITDLPNHSANIRAKARSLREMFTADESGELGKLVDAVADDLQVKDPPKVSADGQPSDVTSKETPKEMTVAKSESNGWISQLPGYLGSAVEILGSAALAIVLMIFMLFSREDLRNRFLRLVGQGRMTFTTKAFDDAADRLSRFLLMQAIVNGTYGIAVAIGLTAVGVHYALLWGFLAAVLRYLPYVGPWIAALFPITLSLVIFEGWWQPLIVIAMFLIFELVSNNVMEPMLYGQSMGVSEVALLIAAAFWTWLWGPIGLVLSAPMTVCLIVLGKYVPQLEFLNILLGDEPPLRPEVAYYQRLLARDQDEATEIVLDAVKESKPNEVYDRLLIPVLNLVRRDRERDDLTRTDEQFILRGTKEILEDVGEQSAVIAANAAPAETSAKPDATSEPIHVLACPARDELDRVALEMLEQMLPDSRWKLDITAPGTLSAELVEKVAEDGPAFLCIGSVPPGGLAHTRYLCKRLRARFPELKIMVGRWGLVENVENNREQLLESGANVMTTTLEETRNQLDVWHPVMVHKQEKPAVA
jgi:predicted PurR-regulated permease PerM